MVYNDRRPERAELLAARERVRSQAHLTPVLRSSTFDRLAGARLFFKAEPFQRMGAFKFRGAWNALSSSSPSELANGVLTHSSGNHAQALAMAAGKLGVRCDIVMPNNAPAVKVAAVRGYGAHVHFCEPTVAARETTAAAVIAERGAMLVHSYDDRRIVAGQSTAAQELFEQVDDGPLDIVMTPVGGGGLVSGTALAAHYFSPGTRVIGAEPAVADDAARSLRSGRIEKNVTAPTIADGLRTHLSELTFGIVRDHVTDIVTVSEAEIVAAMKLFWERMKLIIEPSAAVPVAAALRGGLGPGTPRIGIVLSGGNVDLESLPWMETR